MKILVTSAIELTEEQVIKLSKKYELVFVDNEREYNLNAVSKAEIEGIICNFFFLYNDINSFPNLKFIQLTSVGLERVDLDVISRRNILLFNIRDAYVVPMAEFAIAMTLFIYKQTRFFFFNQQNKIWKKNRSIVELANKKALILGYGRVGMNIAKRLKAFDVRVIGVKRAIYEDDYCDKMITLEEIDKILPLIDILYICLPSTDETFHTINATRLSQMKDTSSIINVSRGEIIDECALDKELKNGKFLGVALDAFESEPLDIESSFWNYENVFISPHNSFVGENNRTRVFEEVFENIESVEE